MRIVERRIGRLGFALGYLSSPACLIAAYSLLDSPVHRYAAFLFVMVLLMLLAVWRCHDFGETPSSHSTEIGAPVTSFAFVASLFSRTGDKGANSYGEPPFV